MSDRLEIKITGSNQASAAFQQVTREATQMGNAVEQSGTKATRSLQDLSAKSAVVGAAIGSATLLLGEWSRAAAEDSAGQARLQQSIENTGKSYDDYSQAVDRAIKAGQEKAFSDDATRDALVRLNTVTKDAGKSIDELGVTMDFARLKGISLSQSADIIAKVYGGNIGILSRYGIVLGQNATAEEALAKIQEISAGQAATYAASDMGWLDKKKDKWDELTESIGGSTGELQNFLALMPGLTAGYTALAGVIGSLGGLKALSTLGALGVGAGVAYLATDALMNQGATGSRDSFTAVNYGLYGASSALNAVLPGNPFDTQKYMDTLASNAIEDVVKGLFYFSPTDNVGNRDLFERLRTAGIIKGDAAPEGAAGDKYIQDQFVAIQRTAGQQGLTTGQYIQGQLKSPTSNFVFDNVSGRWMDLGEYQIYQDARSKAAAATSSTVYGPPSPVWSPSGRPRGTGPGGQDIGYSAQVRLDLAGPGGQPTGNSPFGTGSTPVTGRAIGGSSYGSMSDYRSGPSDSATYSADANNGALQAQTAAVQKLYSAYAGLFDGITSVNDVTSAYKTVQDGLIQEQGVYSQQISEYTSQVNAVEAAHEVLNKRVEEGGTLTKEQQEFQDNYTKALERGNGAVDDAVVAQGMLAEQYLLNMEKGDAMNRALGDSATATSELVGVISELILSMDNVPTEVKTQILLNGADDSIEGLIRYYNWLSSLPGHVTTVIETQYTVTGSDGETRSRGSGTNRLGGVVGYRNGGIPVELAEAGPELLHFRNGGSAWAMQRGVYNVPRGTYVDTAPASRLKAGGGGHTFQINAPITVIANDPRDFGNALHEFALGSSRS